MIYVTTPLSAQLGYLGAYVNDKKYPMILIKNDILSSKIFSAIKFSKICRKDKLVFSLNLLVYNNELWIDFGFEVVGTDIEQHYCFSAASNSNFLTEIENIGAFCICDNHNHKTVVEIPSSNHMLKIKKKMISYYSGGKI